MYKPKFLINRCYFCVDNFHSAHSAHLPVPGASVVLLVCARDLYDISCAFFYTPQITYRSMLFPNREFDLFFIFFQPIQRICKYPVLLGALRKDTPTQHPDYEQLSQALTLLSQSKALFSSFFLTLLSQNKALFLFLFFTVLSQRKTLFLFIFLTLLS